MKRSLLSLALFFLASCERDSPQSNKIEQEDSVEIVFKHELIVNETSRKGVFEISNNGKEAIHVGVIFDTNPARCGFPVFERLTDGEWIEIQVFYEGGVIFSQLDPNQKVLFEVSLDQVAQYKNDKLKLLIASTKGYYYRSKPFFLAGAVKGNKR
jgi:hypothetical protein